MLKFDMNVLFLIAVKIRVVLCNYACLGLCFYFIKSGEKEEKSLTSCTDCFPVIKHFWLSDGKLSIVILFMFWLVTGTLNCIGL